MTGIARFLGSFLLASLTLSTASATVTYSRFLNAGLTGQTTVTAMTVDASGNVYLTGTTTATDFKTTPGVVQPNIATSSCSMIFDPHSPPLVGPCTDAFVVKYDPNGNLVFATYFGGRGSDAAKAIAVDSQGGIYVAGSTAYQPTQSGPGVNNFPTTPGAAFSNQSAGVFDAFITKLNSSGTAVIYSTLIPDAGNGGMGLAVDGAGNAYFGGLANPGDGTFPATPGAFQTLAALTPAALTQAHSVVVKLNPAGSALVYSTYVAGSKTDYFTDLALDSSGNVYITGKTNSPDYPLTAGALKTTPPSSSATAFVSKLNAAGTALAYSTFLGGDLPAIPNGFPSPDEGQRIRVDSQGNAFVFGTTYKQDFPTTSGAFQSGAFVGPWWTTPVPRTFISKINAQGTALVYSTFFDGAATLDVSASGDVYVAGQGTYGFPVTAGASQRCGAGALDAVVARLDSQGGLAAASYLGGSGSEGATGIGVGADGSVYVTGYTTSQDFPGLPALGQSSSAQFSNLFVSHLKISDPSQADQPCQALLAQNGASFVEGPVAPGELITLRGLGFGPALGVQPAVGGAGFPSQIAGVQVLFDGVPAPLLYVQSQQINVQVPWELAGKSSTQVQVQYQGASSNTATLSLVAASPALFPRNYGMNYGTQAAALNADGTANSITNPAKRGAFITVFGTGGGVTSPPAVTGGLSPLSPLGLLVQPVIAQVGGDNMQVLYAGVAPTLTSGLFQLNLLVPLILPAGPNSWTINLTIGGLSSQGPSVTIAIQ